MTKQYLSAFTKVPVLVAALFVALVLPLLSLPEITRADMSNTRADAWGTLEYTGASWFSGAGVNVYSNGSTAGGPSPDTYSCFTITGHTGGLGCPTGTEPMGIKYQCVELFNRFFMTQGWITSRWSGNGNTLISQTFPTGFSQESATATTYVNSGDAITFTNGTPDSTHTGHVGIVDSVSGTGTTRTVNLVNQNTQGVLWTVSWNTSTHTLTQTYLGTGYSVQAIIHRPTPPPPVLSHWIALSGDWDGNGTKTVGLFNPNTNIFYLRNSNDAGDADITVAYGNHGWLPLVGDWTHKGYDSIGLYDPTTATFYLRNSNTAGNADITAQFGNGGTWLPLVGDWDGNGTTTIGTYNPSTATFYLSNSNTSPTANYTTQFGSGGTWIPITGDWDGNGTTTIGVDNTASTFYLSNSNTSGTADLTFTYGNSAWLPIMGDWDGNGTTTVGVYDHSGSTFYLRNSNSTGDADITVPYGNPN